MEMREDDKRQLQINQYYDGIKNHLALANEIMLIGGEPLLIPECVRFIRRLSDDESVRNVKLSILTNATLLHKHMDLLSSFDRLGLIVSLDSVGESYEYIRKGGNWKQTENNLLNFKKSAIEKNRKWTVNISCVVMKSSIPEILKLIDWCATHDFPLHFVPIIEYDFCADEDIFSYPHLLDEIPDWKNILDRAVLSLNEIGWVSAASSLDIIKLWWKAF